MAAIVGRASLGGSEEAAEAPPVISKKPRRSVERAEGRARLSEKSRIYPDTAEKKITNAQIKSILEAEPVTAFVKLSIKPERRRSAADGIGVGLFLALKWNFSKKPRAIAQTMCEA